MVLSATMIGALLGLGTQMYSNALRKLPYMRHPWEHVVGMGLGVVFVNQLVKWDAQLEKDLDKMLQKAKEANERRYFDDAPTGVYITKFFALCTISQIQRVFDSVNGNVKLVKLAETDFYLLLPQIEVLKASLEEAIKMMISASRSL
ncbi:hypothetical protein DKX38_004778 [Salix brachista]|uniref:Uncharacterized protein n=1 Tax=Salix brachista TaxID=2182728 RepID=A0A5N5NB29_9ROSI|nr:hypothetical protein DKX38_004778 [Salix brachista]